MLHPNTTLENRTILVTGAAGFIGANLVTVLLKTVNGVKIIGLDNLNDYYDVSLKEYRLAEIETLSNYEESSYNAFHPKKVYYCSYSKFLVLPSLLFPTPVADFYLIYFS